VGFNIWESAWPTAAFAVLAVVTYKVKSKSIGRTCVALACVGAGMFAVAAHNKGSRPTIDAGPRETLILEGCVVDPPVFSADRGQFTLELSPGARARVTIPLEEGETPPVLKYGQHIEIDGRIHPPHTYNNPGSFDYSSYLEHQNIYWTATMTRRSPPRILAGRCGWRVLSLVYSLRTRALRKLEEMYGADTYSSAMMKAILIGDSSALEKVWTEDFRRTGTFHALVISGVHVTVLAGVLLFLLRLAAMPQIPALAFTAAAAWLYALVSGMSAPVVRAAGGFTLFLIARFVFRRTRVLNLLAAIAIGYLVWDPEQLLDASFQLSFLSVAAIGALAAPLLDLWIVPMARGLRSINDLAVDPHQEPRIAQARVELRLAAETFALWLRIPKEWFASVFAGAGRLLLYATEMMTISTVIQIGLALPMAELFHRVSFTGLSANLLIVPLLNLVVPIGFGAIFTGWRWMAHVASALLAIAAKIATWHARIEPSWRIPDPPVWLALGFVSSLATMAILSSNPAHNGRGGRVSGTRLDAAASCALVRRPVLRWVATVAVLAMFGLLLWQPWPPKPAAGVLELTAIDVAQGDSLLLTFPQGQQILVDGGGILQYGRVRKSNFDMGEDVVSPFLWSRGIRRLDVLVATHAHEDHIGGLKSVMENFRPTEFWVGANPPQTLVERARELGIRVVEGHLGLPFDFGGARVQFLSPPEDYASIKIGNNDSLAFRVMYGSRTFLLTGDMERPMEQILVSDGLYLHADVLKVGHHGSKTSTIPAFLEAVSPSIAIVSAGYENSFGHPHPDVVRRLLDRHITLLRTDHDGLVTVQTDGERLRYNTMTWERGSHESNFNLRPSPLNALFSTFAATTAP
jgi:competence protein ComEC